MTTKFQPGPLESHLMDQDMENMAWMLAQGEDLVRALGRVGMTRDVYDKHRRLRDVAPEGPPTFVVNLDTGTVHSASCLAGRQSASTGPWTPAAHRRENRAHQCLLGVLPT